MKLGFWNGIKEQLSTSFVIGASSGINYLFGKFQFTTAASAPLTSPYTEVGAQGSIVLTDTGNRFYKTGGKLTIDTGGANEANAVGNAAINPSIGRALVQKVQRAGIIDFGLEGYHTRLHTASLYLGNGGIIIDSTFNDERIMAIVFRTTGLHFMDLTNNTLIFTFSVAISGSTKPYFGTAGISPTSIGGTLDDCYVADISDAEWTTQNGGVTALVASPSNGETIAATADGQVEIYWTPSAGGTMDMQVRRISDTSCIIIRCDQTSGTIKTIKQDSGETELDSDAFAFAAGTKYEVKVLLNGSSIRDFVRSTAIGGYSAKNVVTSTFNQTETGAKIVTADTIENFTSWPRSIAAPNFT